MKVPEFLEMYVELDEPTVRRVHLDALSRSVGHRLSDKGASKRYRPPSDRIGPQGTQQPTCFNFTILVVLGLRASSFHGWMRH